MVDPKDYLYTVTTEYKSIRDHTGLEWTTTPPTQEGWYWVYFATIRGAVRFGSRIDPAVHYVEASHKHKGNNGDRMEAIVNTSGWMSVEGEGSLLNGAQWLGPIPPPEPPK